MKKISLTIVVIAVLFLCGGLYLLFSNRNSEDPKWNYQMEDIMIEYSYINGAWGFSI